jgi:hypothetical protein
MIAGNRSEKMNATVKYCVFDGLSNNNQFVLAVANFLFKIFYGV